MGERGRITEISSNALHIEFADHATGPAEGTNPVASFGKKSSHVPANKATRARD